MLKQYFERPKNRYRRDRRDTFFSKALRQMNGLSDLAMGLAYVFVGGFMATLGFNLLFSPALTDWPIEVKLAGVVGGLIGFFCIYVGGKPIASSVIMPAIMRYMGLSDKLIKFFRKDLAWENITPQKPLQVPTKWSPRPSSTETDDETIIFFTNPDGKEDCEIHPSPPLPPWLKY